MQTHLVLTVSGRDRPGLVGLVSAMIADGGGNWLDSHMESLAGQFAGILLVAVASVKADALVASLRNLEGAGLRFIIEREAEQPPAGDRTLLLELVGIDRPGIVRDVSRVLGAANVNIVEFESECVIGSLSDETMFMAKARLSLPDGVDREGVRRSLESLAEELMIDIDLDTY
jgi:glycine cleavage system regulatory protein